VQKTEPKKLPSFGAFAGIVGMGPEPEQRLEKQVKTADVKPDIVIQS
jgi:hypothetical protein